MSTGFEDRFWKDMQQASRLAGGSAGVSTSALLRPCIDPLCHEWGQTDLEDKLKALSLMQSFTGASIEALVQDCHSFCVYEAGKRIRPEEIVVALCRILGYTIETMKKREQREKVMTDFTVTFQLTSFYDEDEFNMTETVDKSYEADSLDDLFDLLDEGDFADELDDSAVLNTETEDSPIEVNVEYVLIHDEKGSEVYRDEDYEN